MSSQQNSIAKMMVVTETINQLISDYEKGKELKVNEIKKVMSKIARKHELSSIPKLVDLVAALPEVYKDKLTSLLKTKPV